MSAAKDMTGQRFGRLIVVGRDGFYVSPKKQSHALWRCVCDCGNITTTRGGLLRNGTTKSCGCLSRDVAREYNAKHGMFKTRLYAVWCKIKDRCNNHKHRDYDRYGGRGITVCAEWQNNFQAFYDWAMANGYDENAPRGQCTIDRIDNDKGYFPDNCRWVDMKTQCNNRSHSGPLPKKIKGAKSK